MAAATTLSGLLDTLTQSLTSALEVPSKLAALPPVEDGVSLLDVKNELLLSYLQNLVFLIILKLRAARQPVNGKQGGQELQDEVSRKLVELRLYLEKGTRPLEDKMRFQIERLVRAADEAERKATAAADGGDVSDDEEGSEAGSGSEHSDGDGDENEDKDEDEDEDGDGDDADANVSSDDERAAARPRLFNLVAPNSKATARDADPEPDDGIYRPPKRERQLMEDPTTQQRKKTERRPNKSATIDEFIAAEMSSVPMAQPSIGTNVEGRGRHIKSNAELAVEAERRAYEETNFVRLPKISKKEKAKLRGAQGKRGAFGGEDFRDISGQVDRINRLTRPRDGPKAGTVKALLEKSRKRGRESGGGGDQIGERFQKKIRVMDSGRRDRGKGRK